LKDAWAERQFYLCVNNESRETAAVKKLMKHLA